MSSVAKPDFETIITRDSKNDNYVSDKMMSFVYFGLAKQMSSEKAVAKKYLHKAMQLDPNRQGGYDLSEEYLTSLNKID